MYVTSFGARTRCSPGCGTPSSMSEQPSPPRLEWITPSSLEQARRCMLSVAFARSPVHRGLCLPNEWSMLGNVAHSVLEQTVRGVLRSEGDLSAAWNAAVETEWARLSRFRLLAPAPEPERARGYQLARLRTLALARKRLVGERREGVGHELAEITLSDASRGIRGRVDLVECRSGGVRIVDFKSSLRGHDGLSPAHRRQLLLYAHLWETAKGYWPSELAIAYLDGAEDTVAVDNSEARALAEEAAATRREFNETVDGRGELSAAKRPDTCRYCDFQCVCASYQELAVGPSWGHSAVGTIVAHDASAGDTRAVTLMTDAGSLRGSEALTIVGLPIEAVPAMGERVAMSHLRANRTGSFSVEWQSRSWPFMAAEAPDPGRDSTHEDPCT